MNVPLKLAAFAALLAAVFAGSAAIGAAVGPIDVGPEHGHVSTSTTSTTAPGWHTGHGDHGP